MADSSHSDIVQSCVVPVDDEIKGAKPVVFVVRRDGSALDEGAVKQYVLENAPACGYLLAPEQKAIH